MSKEILEKIINILKEKSYDIKFECHIFAGKSHIRGIYIYNENNKNLIKSSFDKETLRYFNIKQTMTWYLGERKEILLLEFKNELEIEIPEMESLHVNNYS